MKFNLLLFSGGKYTAVYCANTALLCLESTFAVDSPLGSRTAPCFLAKKFWSDGNLLPAGHREQAAVPGSWQPHCPHPGTSHLASPLGKAPRRGTADTLEQHFLVVIHRYTQFCQSEQHIMMSLLKPQFSIILRCLDKSHWTHRKLSRWLSNQEHKQQ